MTLPDNEPVRGVIAEMYAQDFLGYIGRRNRKRPDQQTTVRDLCRRFRMMQGDVVSIVERSANLVISDFAYIPPPTGADWGTLLLHRFHPQIAPDAPIGAHVVMRIDQ